MTKYSRGLHAMGLTTNTLTSFSGKNGEEEE